MKGHKHLPEVSNNVTCTCHQQIWKLSASPIDTVGAKYTVLLNSVLGILTFFGGHTCRYNNKARLKIYFNMVSYFVANLTNRVKGCPQNMMKRSSDSKFWFWFYHKHLINSLHWLKMFCTIYQEIRNACVNFGVASSLRFEYSVYKYILSDR